MGLETAHPGALERLNKKFNLTDFTEAAGFLRKEQIAVRAFILVNPPFMGNAEGLEWAVKSADFAFGCGVNVVTLIPTRSGNGVVMDRLWEAGVSVAADPFNLEQAMQSAPALKRGRVFADTWELEPFSSCAGMPGGYAAAVAFDEPVAVRIAARGLPGLRCLMSAASYQIAVVGLGFAGSLIAMIARRLGFSVVMIERGRHPRFAIGESSTPLANLLLEEIADNYDLPFLRPLCKWGTWQQQYPQISCGLKRGFTFYHHTLGRPFDGSQLMVGASLSEHIADTHWYRPDFDHFLVQQAQMLGVEYLDETELEAATEETSGMRLVGKSNGQPLNITADFVIDASGPRGFLHRTLRLPEKPLAGFPSTQALFSHFTNVAPLSNSFTAGDVPYPPEQAAVHHVFDGGWIWVLKFNNGIASAGVVATETVARKFHFQSRETAWRNLLRELPSLEESFVAARASIPFIWQPRVAFQSAVVAGRHWAMPPSAAGVIDPLLSTGFPRRRRWEFNGWRAFWKPVN